MPGTIKALHPHFACVFAFLALQAGLAACLVGLAGGGGAGWAAATGTASTSAAAAPPHAHAHPPHAELSPRGVVDLMRGLRAAAAPEGAGGCGCLRYDPVCVHGSVHNTVWCCSCDCGGLCSLCRNL